MTQSDSSCVSVVFASNERGALPLAIAAWSAAEHAGANTTCDICVLSDGISADSKKRLCELVRKAGERHSVRFIEIDSFLLEGLKVKGEQWPRSAWSRVFLPDILPDVHRAIYLDIDILVCTDLRQLLETDMQGAAVGAVLEHVSSANSHFNKRLEIPQKCPGYFNSGVLLMDLDVFRREGLVQRVLDFAHSHEEVLTCPDQDALNGALCDRLFPLHPRWNWHDGLTRAIGKKSLKSKLWRGNTPADSLEAALYPAILHYQGLHKPWLYNHRIERKRYEQCMLRAGLVQSLPLPGFNWADALKRVLYVPLYAQTWKRIHRMANQLNIRRGDDCGTASAHSAGFPVTGKTQSCHSAP